MMSQKKPEPTIYPVILDVPGEKQALKGKEKVRFLSEFSRKALGRSAARLGVALPRLEKSENGAPLPVGGVHWSVSHKSRCVAAVAALQPVGIDIEQIRPVKAGLAERIAAPREWRLFPGDRQASFFRCWTAKEAVLKAAGIGIAGLDDCRIVSLESADRLLAVFQGASWTVAFHHFHQHLTAVAANGVNLLWIGPEDNNARPAP
jgi:4'-phosphopantetheinyl transferase